MGAERRDPVSREIRGGVDLAFADRVLDELDELWRTAAYVPDLDRTLFALAISEVLTNIVRHGGAAAGASGAVAEIAVELEVAESRLEAVIRDSAPPASIDWEAVAMPAAEEESGRGLALARSALDDFRHDAEADGNIWTLRRELS